MEINAILELLRDIYLAGFATVSIGFFIVGIFSSDGNGKTFIVNIIQSFFFALLIGLIWPVGFIYILFTKKLKGDHTS